jgi:Tol biopolymer transport system component
LLGVREGLRPLTDGTWAASRTGRLAILLAILMVATLAIAVVGALRNDRPLGGPNGLLVIAGDGGIRGLDTESGESFGLVTGDTSIFGVSRSPDGRLLAFRTIDAEAEHLEVMGTDGSDRHRVAAGIAFEGPSCNDNWSHDSRWLAAGVQVDGQDHGQILVVDISTGEGQLITTPELDADCPVWSPDDAWIAFDRPGPGSRTVIDVIHPDGTDRRTVSTGIGGGPCCWSADGWIYFDASDGGVERIYRLNVDSRATEQLTGDAVGASWAPALSPDGESVAFIAWRAESASFDLYVAAADGSSPRRILSDVLTFGGWSSDGALLLVAWWRPGDPASGGLAVVHPDGSGRQVLLPFDEGCRPSPGMSCFGDIGWGQARP